MSRFLTWAQGLIPRGEFARSVGVLAGGTAFGQALLLLALPLLTRLYTPEDFGLYGVYMATIGVGLVVFGLRYEQAIPLAATRQEAAALFLLASFLGLTFSSLFLLIAFSAPTSGFIRVKNYKWFVAISIFGLCSAGIYQSSLFWALRGRHYRGLSLAKILQAVGQVLFQLLVGYAYPGTLGLLVGDALGRTLATTYLLATAPLPWRSVFSKPSMLFQVAKDFSSFPKLYLWASLANILSLQAFQLFLPALFGAKSAGQYFLAYRIVASPIHLFSSSSSRVLLSEGAHSIDQAREYASQISRSFLGIGLPVYLGASVLAPHWFPILLGSDWSEAGFYAMILGGMVVFWSVASALSPLLILGKRFSEAILYTVLELAVKLVSLWLGYRAASLSLTVTIYATSAVILNLISVWRFLSVVGINIASWAEDFLLKPLIVSLIFMFVIYGLFLLHPFIALVFWLIGIAAVFWKESKGW